MKTELTPYQRGFQDGRAGRPGPPFPKGDATWAEKLYNRGWMNGRGQKTPKLGGKRA